MSNHKVGTGMDCPVCGDEMVALSDTTTHVTDGDEAICDGCGFKGWVSADEEQVYVNYDGTDEWNVMCAERYAARDEAFKLRGSLAAEFERIEALLKADRENVHARAEELAALAAAESKFAAVEADLARMRPVVEAAVC